MKKKINPFKILLPLLLLAGVFIGSQFFIDSSQRTLVADPEKKAKLESQAMEVPEKWRQADTMEEVMNYFDSRIHSFKVASEHDVIQKTDASFDLAERDGRLHIDKMWFTEYTTFIFYSLDLIALKDLTSESLTDMTMKSISIDPPEGMEIDNTFLNTHPVMEKGGIVHNGKWHHVVAASSLRGEQHKPLEKLDQVMNTSFDIYLPGGERIEVEDVPFSINYDLKDNLIQTIAIDKTVTKDDISLSFHELQLYTTHSELLYEANLPEGKAFSYNLGMHLKSSMGVNRLYTNGPGFTTDKKGENNGIKRAETRSFRKIPEKLTLDLSSVNIVGDDQVSFELDVSEYKGNEQLKESYKFEKEYDSRPRTVKNTDIFLQKIDMNEHTGLEVELSFNAHGDNQRLIMDFPTVFREQRAHRNRAFLEVKNEHNDLARINDLSLNNEKTLRFMIPKNFVSKSDKISITLGNLTYSVDMNQTIKIDTE
ncbi:hypothetical protein [Thalassobacillus pellis]|uniref:hypothetical protein n=1 Tax=Thalassobacillus pellis TaxID=748008 RepID=UPI0019612BDA|nr:hypothetical protein [Thalassobacillus pellis]MBM7554240.1 hypothetical protein [Thalassobacillus pellis]